mmetsp:Transcript_4633/g.13379  ORF Transcript_4633/g.13379 Transcript_4633/m.13379 type:complete len:310 (-) Transcript_4633:135-1064(-)
MQRHGLDDRDVGYLRQQACKVALWWQFLQLRWFGRVVMGVTNDGSSKPRRLLRLPFALRAELFWRRTAAQGACSSLVQRCEVLRSCSAPVQPIATGVVIMIRSFRDLFKLEHMLLLLSRCADRADAAVALATFKSRKDMVQTQRGFCGARLRFGSTCGFADLFAPGVLPSDDSGQIRVLSFGLDLGCGAKLIVILQNAGSGRTVVRSCRGFAAAFNKVGAMQFGAKTFRSDIVGSIVFVSVTSFRLFIVVVVVFVIIIVTIIFVFVIIVIAVVIIRIGILHTASAVIRLTVRRKIGRHRILPGIVAFQP